MSFSAAGYSLTFTYLSKKKRTKNRGESCSLVGLRCMTAPNMPRIHQVRPAAAPTNIGGLYNAAKLVDKETHHGTKSYR